MLILTRRDRIREHKGGIPDSLVGDEPAFVAEVLKSELECRRVGLRERSILPQQFNPNVEGNAGHESRTWPSVSVMVIRPHPIKLNGLARNRRETTVLLELRCDLRPS